MHDTFRFRKFSLLTPSTLILAFVFVFSATVAHAKDYAHIVVFGDSLSDTGNVAHLSYEKYGVPIPGPYVNYTLGRFSDGPDTVPYARKYFGVWVEQLAASMPLHPEVKNSLDGGTNYAYGFAFTGDGTTTLDFDAQLSVDVKNMGQQVTDYLLTKPKIDSSTLFIVWGGANNLNYAQSPTDVVNAAIQETLDIQRLIDAGARETPAEDPDRAAHAYRRPLVRRMAFHHRIFASDILAWSVCVRDLAVLPRRALQRAEPVLRCR